MAIAPNSTIYLLSTPLDKSQHNQFDFQSASAQQSYFSGIVKHTFDNYTYVGKDNTIRVGACVDTLYDSNYVMYRNKNHGTKWFYCFITSMKYINDNTTEITIKTDVYQTWLFEMSLKQCFVEREHVEDDTIGLHTIPEQLETGEYITTAESDLKVTDLGVYILCTDANDNAYWNDPAIVGGFPVPCYWASLGQVSSFSMTVLKAIIDSYAVAGKSDAIVAVFTAPWNMVSTQTGIREQYLTCASRTLNYTPKNNKLYCYPYVSLSCVALGQGMELRYENFTGTPQLKIRGGFGANMQVSAIPMNYEGQAENVQNTLSIKDFPLCAWTSNYYQNWLAQNKASLAVSTVTSAVSVGVGAGTMIATGGLVGLGGVTGGLSSIANNLASVYQHSIIPDKMTGSANAADINAVSGVTGFYTYCRAIKEEYAKVIDDYFNMYGYKVCRVKQPATRSRANWNYVKTVDANISGSIPIADKTELEKMYNDGVTFWHSPSNFGNYSLSNNIV